MAKFKVFNIQLLPSNGGQEVGVSGYKKLFSKLRDLNDSHLKNKTHLRFHYQVSKDIYIGPLDFNFPSGCVTGRFVRYRNTERVTDLATGKALFQAKSGKGGVTTKRDIPFVFDAKRHYFAIDSAIEQKSDTIISALFQLLDPIAKECFPNHNLTINLISKRNELENVFKTAVSYKTVRIYLNGPNGSDALDVLGEMRDTKIQKLELDISGGTGRMIRLPDFIKRILRSVPGHGWSVVTYFVRDNQGDGQRERMQTFDSREQPKTFVVRQSSAGDKTEFLERVQARLEKLDIHAEVDEDDEAE